MHMYAHTLQFLTHINLIIVQYKPNITRSLNVLPKELNSKVISNKWLPISTDQFLQPTKCNYTVPTFAMAIQFKRAFHVKEYKYCAEGSTNELAGLLKKEYYTTQTEMPVSQSVQWPVTGQVTVIWFPIGHKFPYLPPQYQQGEVIEHIQVTSWGQSDQSLMF